MPETTEPEPVLEAVACDLCTSVGQGTPGPHRLGLTLPGRAVALDLCGAHLDAAERSLAPLLAVARAGDGEGARRRPRPTAGGAGDALPRLRPGEQREEIRAWAQARGLPVARTGTISAAVLQTWRDSYGCGAAADEGA